MKLSISKRLEILEAWDQCKDQTTMLDFCKDKNITRHSLRYWMKKHARQGIENSSFVQVNDYFPAQAGIEIHYPNGVYVQISDHISIETIKSLILL